MRTIKTFDSFAGIGGFHLGLNWACNDLGLKHECVGASEIWDIAQNSYEANHGFRPEGDIWKIDFSKVPDFDILMGGFPCQAFSVMGKAFALNGNKLTGDDHRAELFLALVQILREKQPKAFIFENVPNIQKVKDDDNSSVFDTIIEAFQNAGYNVSYQKVNSFDYGLPQQRYRVYFVGIRKNLNLHYEFVHPVSDAEWNPIDNRVPCINDILDEVSDEDWHLYDAHVYMKRRKNSKVVGANRLDSMVKSMSKRKHIMKRHENSNGAMNQRFGTIVPIAIVYGDMPSGASRQQDRVYDVRGIAPTIATFSTPAFNTAKGWRKLTPRECLKVQGFPADLILTGNIRDKYKQVGNAVSPPVVHWIARNLLEVL